MHQHRLPGLRAFAVLLDHRFHDLDNLRLLSAWQSGHRIKGLPGFARRPATVPLGSVVTNEFLHCRMEDIGQPHQLFRAQGNRVALPISVSVLGNPQLFANLCLGEAGGFAQSDQPFTERRSRFFRWSAG